MKKIYRVAEFEFFTKRSFEFLSFDLIVLRVKVCENDGNT